MQEVRSASIERKQQPLDRNPDGELRGKMPQDDRPPVPPKRSAEIDHCKEAGAFAVEGGDGEDGVVQRPATGAEKVEAEGEEKDGGDIVGIIEREFLRDEVVERENQRENKRGQDGAPPPAEDPGHVGTESDQQEKREEQLTAEPENGKINLRQAGEITEQ